MRRALRLLAWTFGLLGAVALLCIAVLMVDANPLKGPIARMVSDKTGRTLAIDGDLDLHLHWPLRFSVEGVRFENSAWADRRDMLRLERAEITVAVLPLLRGRVVLPLIALTRPDIDLERAADGTGNWTLAAAPADGKASDPQPPPEVGRLTVDQGNVRFRDVAPNTLLEIELATTATGLQYRAGGRYKGLPVDSEGTGGSILSLADTQSPYPFDVKFKVGPTQGVAAGRVTGLTALAAAEIDVDVRGESLSELFPLVQLNLIPSPPYRLRGHVIREGAWWRFHHFDGRIGDSDLSGDVDVLYENGRSRMEARLESQVLDLDDIGGAVGAPPDIGPGETASPQQAEEAARKAAAPTLLPDVPLKLNRLRAMDGDITFHGRSIRGKTPVDDLRLHVLLDHGVLQLRPLDFGIANGHVVSALTVDGRGDVAGVDADVTFRRLDLRRLFPGNATIARSTGIVGGHAVIKGRGNSTAQVLATADGTLGLAMSGGQVSNLVMELAGLDAGEALKFLFGGDRQVKVRCAVADAGLRHGVLETRSAVVDTTDTNVKLDGTLDLQDERLDLTLQALPKDYSILSLRSPLHVHGTFKHLAVRPDRGLAVRGGVAAILGALAGPLGLVALIETGPGDDVDCERLVAAVERHNPPPPQAAAAPRG